MKALAALIAPSMSTEEITARIDALVPHLAARFSPGTFSPESLTHTAELCRFFPNFAELCEHLAAWKRPRYPIYGGAAGYITHEAPPPEPRGAQSDEQRRMVTEAVQNARAQLAALGEAKQDAYAAQLSPRPAALPLSRAQLVEAYRQAGIKGPQIPEPTQLRAAATPIQAEVKRSTPIDGEPGA